MVGVSQSLLLWLPMPSFERQWCCDSFKWGNFFPNQRIDGLSCTCSNQVFLMSKNPPTEMQLAILQLGSLVKWTVAHVARNLVAITHRSFARWKQLRLPSLQSIGNHVTWTKMALFQRFRPTSPRFTLQTAIEFPKRDVEFDGIIESCLLAVNSDPFVSGPRLAYFVNSKCTAWKQFICCNGVERIWLFCSQWTHKKPSCLQNTQTSTSSSGELECQKGVVCVAISIEQQFATQMANVGYQVKSKND